MHNFVDICKRTFLAEWQQRLTAVLVAFFMLQYINWIAEEETLWLIETVILAKWTLFFVCISYLIPRINDSIRLLLQLLLILYVHASLLGYSFISVSIDSFELFREWLILNFGQLEPFIWFSISTWILFQFCMWMTKAKLRIYLMILVSVLFFAIRDSFSLLILWQQVALILFCGLSLLIIRHFSELKIRAPKSWEALAEYPASIGVPIILLVALTIVIGALAPTVNPVLTDPYTAWKVSRGEPVAFNGKGLPINIPNANASSGYSRDDSQLGGGFSYDYTPVLTVDTSQRTYLRGETRSLYNGTGWELSDAEKRLPLGVVDQESLPADARFNTSKLKTLEVKQIVHMQNDIVYPILFGAYSVQKVESLNDGRNQFETLRWSARQSEIRFTAKKDFPDSYSLVSQVPIVDEVGLRQTAANYANLPEWGEYLQLPRELPARVKELALKITQNATNPYDKIKLIEEYLRLTFPYTSTPDESKGQSKDFVDRFLFEIKEGYCDYYSTSMVVLSRSIGIPARWVKGYSSGQSPILDEMLPEILSESGVLDPDGAGLYTVRNADAHSWVEVYFDGWGWIPFEPTAGFSIPNALLEVEPEVVAPEVDTPAVTEPVVEAVEESYPWVRTLSIAAAILVLIAAAGWTASRLGYMKAWKQRFIKVNTINFNQKIIVEFERLLRYSKRKGYARGEHETMREAVARWSQRSKWMKADLETVLNLFEKAKYSKDHSSEQDYERVSQAIEKLRTQMK
jgi:transglutaminase-like putative cysteine protease